MTSIDAVRPVSSARNAATLLYSATLFLSAALLFSLEPMFSSMVLPELGGSSAVWSVAMAVFQGLLLCGYLYAYLLIRFLGSRRAVLVHLAVMTLALFWLPVAIAHGYRNPPAFGVPLWTTLLFFASIGVPFFAVAANAPLLQAWFSELDANGASNPYFLYRASNLGSFVLLLAYPFLIEPVFGLAQQSRLWSLGYGVLLGSVLVCGLRILNARSNAPRVAQKSVSRASGMTRLSWVALGFVPSGMLVAVTAHITTDVASAPFLWVVPLALYLASFVVAFAERPVLPLKAMLAVQPLTVAALAILFLWLGKVSWAIALPCHLLAFFVAAMVCHTRLYQMRPAAAGLTGFYVWMSLGGVLGGMFSALVAPELFTTVLEYPLLAVAALLARPGALGALRTQWRTDGLFVAVLLGAFALAFVLVGDKARIAFFAAAIMLLALFTALQGRKPFRLVVLSASLLLVTNLYDPTESTVARARSFYGVYKVSDVDGGRFRVLFHGVTAHGAERVRDEHGTMLGSPPEPLTYYFKGGALSEAIDTVRRRDRGRLGRVGVIGLGVGALTCYARPDEQWTVYELDPLVVKIASDRALFRSMSVCAKGVRIVTGDGRLSLAASDSRYDLLILDAFSSDAIPTHLLTREAFALYAARLAPHGVMVINISNKNVELADIVAASAGANSMAVAVKTDPGHADPQTLRMPAQIAVVAKSGADLGSLHLSRDWHAAGPAGKLWTDDYANVAGAVVEKLAE